MIANVPADMAWGAMPNGIVPVANPTVYSNPTVYPSELLHPQAAILTPSPPDNSPPVNSLSAAALRHYLLVCHARSLSITHGVWCFSLESISGESILDAECEDQGDLNRLSLLAAVRGLESIDGRGLVSLISNNRYLIRSLDRSLPRWRENNFVWEQFGRKTPVQNADLWRRIDRTLGIHQITASLLQSTRLSNSNDRIQMPNQAANQGIGAIGELPWSRVDAGHSQSNSPSDGLRRWLAGNCDAAPQVAQRGRNPAADFANA